MIKFGKKDEPKAANPKTGNSPDTQIVMTDILTAKSEAPRTGMLGRLGDKGADEPLPYSLEVQAEIVAQETTTEDLMPGKTKARRGSPKDKAE